LTKFGVKHPWVVGVQICSYDGAGSPRGATRGNFANIKKSSSYELQMTELGYFTQGIIRA